MNRILAPLARANHRKAKVPDVKISVLTPAHNAGKYIDDLLTSVQRQDYGNVEHIVIDDGSTDNTFEILRKYQHVTAICRENKGQYATHNELTGLASGDVIVFISADDYLASPVVLRHVAEAFAAEPSVDVVVGRTPRRIEGSPSYLARTDVPLWLGTRTLPSLLTFQHCSVYVRRALVERHGIQFDEGFRTRGDWDFLIRVFAAARRVKLINEDLAIYRLHPEQTSAVARGIGMSETMRLLERHGSDPRKHLVLREAYDAYAKLAHLLALLIQLGPTAAWRKLSANRCRRSRL